MSKLIEFKDRILKKYIDNYIKYYIIEKPKLNIEAMIDFTATMIINAICGYIYFSSIVNKIYILSYLTFLGFSIIGIFNIKLIFDFIKRYKTKDNLIKTLNNKDLLEENFHKIIRGRFGDSETKYLVKEIFIKNGIPSDDLEKDEIKELISLLNHKDYKLILEKFKINKSLRLDCRDVMETINEIELEKSIKDEFNLIDETNELEMEVNSQTLKRLL